MTGTTHGIPVKYYWIWFDMENSTYKFKILLFSGISLLYLFIPASILEQKYLTFPIHKLKNA